MSNPDFGTILKITGEEFGKGLSFNSLRKAAQKFMQTLRGKALETANGEKLLVDREGSKHPLSGYRDALEIKALARLPELLRQAKRVSCLPDDGSHEGVLRWHYYKASAEIEGQVYEITLVARELDDGKRFYESYILGKKKPKSHTGHPA